jgi:hypothetical protein
MVVRDSSAAEIHGVGNSVKYLPLSTMKHITNGLKVLFILTLTSVALSAFAKPPASVPPHGRAYGYFLQDGGRVLFLSMEADGTRLIELSECHQNRRYAIEASQDLRSWQGLTVLQVQADGRASFHDLEPQPHRYYRVIRSN